MEQIFSNTIIVIILSLILGVILAVLLFCSISLYTILEALKDKVLKEIKNSSHIASQQATDDIRESFKVLQKKEYQVPEKKTMEELDREIEINV